MKRTITSVLIGLISWTAFAQQKAAPGGYEIKISIKGLKDTVCYLTKYQWEKQYLVDTGRVKNGTVTFKGKQKLERGIYSVVRQNKSIMFFDMLIDEPQRFSISTDTVDVYKNMKITGGGQLYNDFVDFVVTMSSMHKESWDFEQAVKARKDPDSTKLIRDKQVEMYDKAKKYHKAYLEKNPNTYLATIIRLQMEVEMPEIPKASNGRKDSIFEYQYYKNHYWDNIPLDDIGTVNTNKLFYDRLKRYWEKVILQVPDSMIKEAEILIKKTGNNKDMFKYMVFYFTYSSESSKIMGHDAVFVHMVNQYYKTKKAFWVDEKTNAKIVERGETLEPLLIGKKASNLQMLDTTGARVVKQLKIDTITNSDFLTKTFYDNIGKFQKLWVPLHDVKADYTVLLFYDVDCGHCKKEVPLIHETYKKLKAAGKKIEVYAVYTQFDLDKWKTFIKEHKLDWINVYDGVHLNNIRKKFDIFSTPVIYMLDKDKTIRAKRISHEQIEDLVKFLDEEYKRLGSK